MTDFISDVALNNVLKTIISRNGLFNHQIEPMNALYEKDLPELIQTLSFFVLKNPLEDDAKRYDLLKGEVRFDSVEITQACETDVLNNQELTITPTETLLNQKTYSAMVNVRMITTIRALKAKDKKTKDKLVFDKYSKEYRQYNFFEEEWNEVDVKENSETINLFNLPIMVGSSRCNTLRLSKKELFDRDEAIQDVIGYFVVKGQEYIMNSTELASSNVLKFHNIGKKPLRMSKKVEFTQRDLQNRKSNQLSLFISNDQNIYVLSSGMRDVLIPLFLFLDIIGCSLTDEEIESKLLQDCKDKKNSSVYTFVDNLFKMHRHTETTEEILELAKELYKNAKEKKEEDLRPEFIKYINNEFENNILFKFTNRKHKILFILYSINQLIKNDKNILNTDRDSYIFKRVAPPAKEFLKTIKSIVSGDTLVKSVKEDIGSLLTKSSFSSLNLSHYFRSNTAELSDKISNIIKRSINTSGDFVTRDKTKVKNTIQANMMLRKNLVNCASQLRMVQPYNSSKTESANTIESKRTHSSYIGALCTCSTSPDSDSVGVKKALSFGGNMTNDISPRESLLYLENAKETFKGRDWFNVEKTYKDVLVYIDGLPLYFIDISRMDEFVSAFKKARRSNEFDKLTSILKLSKQNEIHIQNDAGRLYRPVVVVEDGNILLTTNDLIDIDIKQLFSEGKIEYLTVCEAATTALVATSYEEFVCSGDVKKFNYIEFNNGIYSLSFSSPYNNHDQGVRSVYYYVQNKQVASENVSNHNTRNDKDLVHLITHSVPFCLSSLNFFVNEIGGRTINFGISTYTGSNQEDSSVMREGLVSVKAFCCVKSDVSKHIKEKGEEIEPPEIGDNKPKKFYSTDNISRDRSNGNIPGVIKKGTIIGTELQEALISRTKLVEDPSLIGKIKNKKEFILYTKNEAEFSVITDVREVKGMEEHSIIIKETKLRVVVVGDKFTNHHSQKNIISTVIPDIYLPFTITGMRPDILWNPHGLPTRMTVGQKIEALITKMCIDHAFYLDGSAFLPFPVQILDRDDVTEAEYTEELSKKYINLKNNEVLISNTVKLIMSIKDYFKSIDYCEYEVYDPLSGEKLDGKMVIYPIYYQRLLKEAVDSMYSASETNTSPHTRQPTDGQKYGGGLKLGEMEKDIFIAHGSVKELEDFYKNNSDGVINYICLNCGADAIVDYNNKNNYKDGASCPNCASEANVVPVSSTFVCNKVKAIMEQASIKVVARKNPYQNIKTLSNENDIVNMIKKSMK